MRQLLEPCNFARPPLNEVVLGVQFSSPAAYRNIHLGGVFDLFKEEFPIVEDQPRLPPQFETFGGSGSPSFQFEFGPPPLRSRTWFVSHDESHLIQFQDDRLLMNWRKRHPDQQYPRYERIVEKAVQSLELIEGFFRAEFQHRLSINQAEITYINFIPVDSYADIGRWIKLFDLRSLNAEGVTATFSEVVTYDSRVVGRLTTECHSALNNADHSKALQLSFTFRGAPFGDTIDSARDLLDLGRAKIIGAFCDITTEQAQAVWGRD